MEKLRVKNWMVIGMITAGMFSTTEAFAKDRKEGSIAENRFSTRKEYKDMKASMSRIENDKERIDYHKAAYKANKKSDLVIESHMSKKEFRKAKADLKRDKKFLRIDKRDLKWDQKVALQEARKEERQLTKDLRRAKWTLRKDVRKGNAQQLDADAKQVAHLTAQKEKKEEANLALKEDQKEFFALLDEEIDQLT